MSPVHFINGNFVDSKKALIPVDDLGVLRGFGVFDYLRTYDQKPFLLNWHLERFLNSAKYAGLKVPYKKKEIKEIINKLIKKNNFQPCINQRHKESFEYAFRIILTGGESQDSKISKKPSFFILSERPHILPTCVYKKGAKIFTLNYQRECPEAKTINYFVPLRIWKNIKSRGGIEVLYHFRGRVSECSTSNFFIVKNQEVIIPKSNILKGITRKVVLKIIKGKIKYKERDVLLKEIFEADEAFLSSTDKEIVPVVKIDNFKIGKNGRVGKITKSISLLFQNFIKSQENKN